MTTIIFIAKCEAKVRAGKISFTCKLRFRINIMLSYAAIREIQFFELSSRFCAFFAHVILFQYLTLSLPLLSRSLSLRLNNWIRWPHFSWCVRAVCKHMSILSYWFTWAHTIDTKSFGTLNYYSIGKGANFDFLTFIKIFVYSGIFDREKNLYCTTQSQNSLKCVHVCTFKNCLAAVCAKNLVSEKNTKE